MFSILNKNPAQKPSKATILSMEGNCYLATTLDDAGNIIQRSETPFKCISQARDWLIEHGAENKTINFEHPETYDEMIGEHSFSYSELGH